MHHAVELFVSSAPGDQVIREELCARLAAFVDAGIVRESVPAAPPTDTRALLHTADVILVLVSPEALTSGSLVEAILREGLTMERNKRAVVIPLRARAGAPEEAGLLADRTLYPRDGRALDEAEHRDEIFREAIAGVLTGVTLCHVMVGDYLLDDEREAAAAAAFQRGMTLAERLAGDAPDDQDHRSLLAITRDRYADALLAAGDGPGALAAYKEALVVRDRLARDAPDDVTRRGALARCHESIGEVLRAMGEKPEALAAYRACLALREDLAESTYDDEARRDLYATYGRIGHVLRAMGDSRGALEAFRTGLKLAARLAAEQPDMAAIQGDHALFCFRAATVLAEGTSAERLEARSFLRRALAIYRVLEERELLTEAQAIWPPAVEALLTTLGT
ncbi:tetratricopeptide repeat protein [Polyangium sp. 15x6]|uniref:tetratricopeptide repeat protein n=1 Tax=Polyangium sp. 15x6 TaxID=3042687 RepID=UPI00249B8643|nr:tetratricopeptide repeat protein [Polyangium sp. 15x6]MDI3289697.1 tetratricopeptide repeat protein [Polyangium sp. 15x6]